MDAGQLLLLNSKQPKGIMIPEILLMCEGEVVKLFQTLDGVGLHPGLLQFSPVKGNQVVYPIHCPSEALQLELLQFPPGHGLKFRLKQE